eukprot:1207725-Amphidinium_carterae.1
MMIKSVCFRASLATRCCHKQNMRAAPLHRLMAGAPLFPPPTGSHALKVVGDVRVLEDMTRGFGCPRSDQE